MAKKRGVGGESSGNWMDTYGDMVTLLLTFFIMLYATSSPDEVKWQQILQAFTSRGTILNPIIADENKNEELEDYAAEELADGEMPESFDELFQYLVNYVDASPFSRSMEVTKGAANIYLKFRDDVFFEGDSHELLQIGQDILSDISIGIGEVEDKILGIKVSGHTAKAEFSSQDDFTLAAMRAVKVVNFLKSLEIVEPLKLSQAGLGEHRPIVPNDTPENQALNRRVELIIFRNDVDLSDPLVVDEFLRESFGAAYVSPEGLLSENMVDTSDTDTPEDTTLENTDGEDVESTDTPENTEQVDSTEENTTQDDENLTDTN